MLLPQRSQPLLLGGRVDVSSDKERDKVKEWHPRLLGQEVLGKSKREWRSHPADFHDGQETGADGRADLMESAGACDDGHGGQVDSVLDRRDLGDTVSWNGFEPKERIATYNQVADDDLEDLGLQTCPSCEQLLQGADEDVADGSADEGTIDGHLGHTRCEIVSILVAILCDPRCNDFLQC